MKKFVELIQRVNQERFPVVMNKVISEKIPIAFLSVTMPLENAAAVANHLRTQGLNITTLISSTTPPHEDLYLEFDVVSHNDISKLHPRPEYIFNLDLNGLDSRWSAQYLPECKNVSLNGPFRDSDKAYIAFMSHLTNLQEVYESFIDEESRREFYGYWLGNITHQFGEFVHSKGGHYFTAGFIPEPGAIVIDGGVLNGATAGVYSDLKCKVYAFEMDKINFEDSKIMAQDKGFTLENLGLGAFEHEMKYLHAPFGNPGASRLDSSGSETAKIVSLDSYVLKHRLPRVDCIKLDVEGAELDVLKGATTTLARWKPLLILSAYHKWDDFWTLMNFVKSIRPDYEFALRHYGSKPEDVKDGFAKNRVELLKNLGLDIMGKGSEECCLLAR